MHAVVTCTGYIVPRTFPAYCHGRLQPTAELQLHFRSTLSTNQVQFTHRHTRVHFFYAPIRHSYLLVNRIPVGPLVSHATLSSQFCTVLQLQECVLLQVLQVLLQVLQVVLQVLQVLLQVLQVLLQVLQVLLQVLPTCSFNWPRTL